MQEKLEYYRKLSIWQFTSDLKSAADITHIHNEIQMILKALYKREIAVEYNGVADRTATNWAIMHLCNLENKIKELKK